MFGIILTNNIPVNIISYETKSKKHLKVDKEKIRMLQKLENKPIFQSNKPYAALQITSIEKPNSMRISLLL